MGLRSALSDWRNRLISKPGFRRWAKTFPLTRSETKKNAGALFDLMAGFVYFQTLHACFQISLFDFLKDGARPLNEIADHAGLPLAGAEKLMRAAASLNLLDARDSDHYALGPLGAALVDEPGLAAMAEHHQLLYQDLVQPLDVLRGQANGKLAQFWGYGASEESEGRPEEYSALMAATLPMVAEEAIAAYDFRAHKRMLDVGGGEGAFVSEIARHAPNLELGIFDLPPVAERARKKLGETGLDARVEIHAGSFLTDSLPGGFDLISLIRIAHDHSDEEVMRLLAACRAAILPRGTLILAEPMAEAPGASAMGDAYFGFYLSAMGRGRPRSASDLMRMLEASGFTGIRMRRGNLPLIAQVVTAKSPTNRKV